ncbi:MAG: hypothetical protein ACRDHY_00785 [Anaerolineales bacterium]
MALRYPVAAIGGYLAFLLGLRLWLLWIERDRGRRGRSFLEGLDPGTPDLTPSSVDPDVFGGGGGFSGGGAGGELAPGDGFDGSPVPDLADVGLDVDEGVVFLIPLLGAVLLIVGLVSVLGVVWNAPALLAEVLLDGAITTVAYRQLRDVPAEDWFAGVWRRTWKPMVAIVVLLTGLGWAAQRLVPGADSIGDFFIR